MTRMQDPLACSDTDLHEEKQQLVHLIDFEHENEMHTIHFKTQQDNQGVITDCALILSCFYLFLFSQLCYF